MKKTGLKSLLSLLLCLVLLAAAALSVTAAAEETAVAEKPAEFVIPATDASEEIVILLNGTKEEPVVLGEGAVAFLFEVIDPEGNESWFEIHTDQTVLGDALLEQLLISGTDSEYGLMVDTVVGIQLIWTEENPHYWALYEDENYAQVGVSSMTINPETVYSFRAE